jgi:hypothetical protein
MASTPSSNSSKSEQYLTQLRAAVSNRASQSEDFSDSEELAPLSNIIASHQVEAKDFNSSSHGGRMLMRNAQKVMKKLDPVDLMNSKQQNLIIPWDELGHVEMIHRQGLGSPPTIIQRVTQKSQRPYYKLFLPQNSSSQKDVALYCRKKQKEDVYRFSLDGDVMTKKNNSAYVGSMISEDSGNVWHLFNKSDACIAQIRISKKEVNVTLINEYLNLIETGSSGREFSGIINSFLDPILSLKVSKSDRAVFEFANPIRASDAQMNSRPRYFIEFDYPFTLFLSFSIAVLTESLLKSSLS